MRRLLVVLLTVGIGSVVGCSSTDWVHPNKPSSEFTADYNHCQNLVMRDPKLQQGNQLMVINATERCLQREGWRLIEKE